LPHGEPSCFVCAVFELGQLNLRAEDELRQQNLRAEENETFLFQRPVEMQLALRQSCCFATEVDGLFLCVRFLSKLRGDLPSDLVGRLDSGHQEQVRSRRLFPFQPLSELRHRRGLHVVLFRRQR
jgi:hypothetical protein